MTAIMYATQHPECVELLLPFSDLLLTDKESRTAEDWADETPESLAMIRAVSRARTENRALSSVGKGLSPGKGRVQSP